MDSIDNLIHRTEAQIEANEAYAKSMLATAHNERDLLEALKKLKEENKLLRDNQQHLHIQTVQGNVIGNVEKMEVTKDKKSYICPLPLKESMEK